MKKLPRFLAAILLSAFAFLVTTQSLPAVAEDAMVGTDFAGFAFEKSTVTVAMKSQISRWIEENASEEFTIVSCTGYTGYNVNRRDRSFLKKLALARATNVCNYIKSLRGVITISSTQGIPGNGKTAAARKVSVRLIAPEGGSGGSGGVVIGSCDNSINIKMRSRISANEFSFDQMTLSAIATSCRGNVIDIYLLDASGNQLAFASSLPILGTTLTASYGTFSPSTIKSNLIRRVAIEIRSQ